jgi:hypothetical protein
VIRPMRAVSSVASLSMLAIVEAVVRPQAVRSGVRWRTDAKTASGASTYICDRRNLWDDRWHHRVGAV